MVSLTGNVTVDEDGSAEFRCEIDANPMNKGQLISKDIFVPIMCLIDASPRVATHHLDDLDLFTFLFSIRMLLDK